MTQLLHKFDMPENPKQRPAIGIDRSQAFPLYPQAWTTEIASRSHVNDVPATVAMPLLEHDDMSVVDQQITR